MKVFHSLFKVLSNFRNILYKLKTIKFYNNTISTNIIHFYKVDRDSGFFDKIQKNQTCKNQESMPIYWIRHNNLAR